MNLKVASCCVCYLFWAFLIPQTQTFRHEDIDLKVSVLFAGNKEFTNTASKTYEFIGHEDIDLKRIKEDAAWTSGLLAGNKELINTAPKTYKFIRDLATDAKLLATTVNPAYAATAAATVYFTAVVAVSYYYSIDAQQQMQKAQFKKDELKIIIDTKIIPILGSLEMIHSKGNMTENFCKAKSTILEQCKNALTSLQILRYSIEQQMLDSISGTGKNKVLQWLTGAGALAGIGAIGVMGINPPVMVVGLSALASGFVGVSVGYNNIKSYEDAMCHLEEAKLETLHAEIVLGKMLTKYDIFCAVPALFQLSLELLEELKLEHENLKFTSTDRL